MEYPPRKFHPDRKDPEKLENPQDRPLVSRALAATNRMVRDLLGLDVNLVDDVAEHEERKRRYELHGQDLIENMPEEEQRVRRQNLVHFDIDPTNSECN